MFKHARKHPPARVKMADGRSDPARPDQRRRATDLRTELLRRDPRLGIVRRLVDLVVWLRALPNPWARRKQSRRRINEFKNELETLHPDGYTLRTRYPSDGRSKGKQRWQKSLWTDFFQNQGFHHDDSDTIGDDQDTLIYQWEPR